MTSTQPTIDVLNGVAPLTHWGVIRVEGEDASAFVHGQFTNDFVLLGADVARYAGYCNAQGRLLATVIGIKRHPGEILLVISKDLLEPTLKRLKMFVLRAKVQLTDASTVFALYGLVGATLENAMDSGAFHSGKTWARVDLEVASLIRLPSALGLARALLISQASQSVPAGPALPLALWHWSQVCSGVAMLTLPVREAFVPQMLNMESTGGVSFKKGCYPGQEVVARSQFRGTLKRRAYLAHADVTLPAGDEIFSADDAAQPCGLVVESAPCPTGGFDAIVVLQVSAQETAHSLHLGPAPGPHLQVQSAPYPLLSDI